MTLSPVTAVTCAPPAKGSSVSVTSLLQKVGVVVMWGFGFVFIGNRSSKLLPQRLGAAGVGLVVMRGAAMLTGLRGLWWAATASFVVRRACRGTSWRRPPPVGGEMSAREFKNA